MRMIKFSFSLFLLIMASCIEEPVNEKKYIEPQLVSIDKNLKFTYGPSWEKNIPDSIILPVIELNAYEIGTYEVTNMEYEKFVIDSGYKNPSCWSDSGWKYKSLDNWLLPLYWSEKRYWLDDPYSNKRDTPVHGISYYEAEAYCKWLSIKTQKNYHVPSSYQWTRAAKGPDPGNKYPWGADYNRDYANFIPGDEKVSLVQVFKYQQGKSYDGCYNMVGNVLEICLNLRKDNPFMASVLYYSTGSFMSSTLKGDHYYQGMITTSCGGTEKEDRFYALGFRIVKEK